MKEGGTDPLKVRVAYCQLKPVRGRDSIHSQPLEIPVPSDEPAGTASVSRHPSNVNGRKNKLCLNKAKRGPTRTNDETSFVAEPVMTEQWQVDTNDEMSVAEPVSSAHTNNEIFSLAEHDDVVIEQLSPCRPKRPANNPERLSA